MLLLETLKDAMMYMLESAVCLAIFYLFYRYMLSNERCFQYNRFYLLAAVIFSIVFPLIHVNYNPVNTPTVLNSIHEVSNEPIVSDDWIYTITAKSLKPFFFWWEAVALGYALVVIFLGIRLFIRIRSMHDFVWSRRREMRYEGSYYRINTGGAMPTFSFFKYLFWDNSQKLSESEAKQVLDHEKVHIKQKHSVDIMFMEILKVIFWFNPLIYLYKSTFEDVHEYEADKMAARHYGSKAYIQLLVKIVFDKMGFQLGSHFAKNQTLRRVKMINLQRHISPFKLLLPIPIVAMLFFIFSCEAVNIDHKVDIQEIAYQAGFTEDDTRPVPLEGFDQWTEKISYDIEYAMASDKYAIEGEVVVVFDVDKEGQINDVKIVKSLKRAFDKTVVDILLASDKWAPGIKSGEEVNTKIKIPIKFRKT